MLNNQHPNKYTSPVRRLTGHHSRLWSVVFLWGITILLSGFFVGEIHLYGITVEQSPNSVIRKFGQSITTLIEDHPSTKQLSNFKNELRDPLELFYDREMRLGTIHPAKVSSDVGESEIEPKRNFGESEIEIPTIPPKKIMLLGGSSMKTALGSLLQAEFRKNNVAQVREAQIGTGLARADVVNWPSKIESLLKQHPDTDLVLLQFIGNDCQTIVDANHKIIAKFGEGKWKSSYLEQWETVKRIIELADAELIIVGLPSMKSTRFDQRIKIVTSWVTEWASNYDIKVIETRSVTTDIDGNYQQFLPVDGRMLRFRHADGIHLSFKGSQIVSQHIFSELNSTFQWVRTEQPKPN